nr:MAG TPA: hypothetical protein [Caudoviricetes sp.]DAK65350.1 MAG TPA: hypothetical protein [Caudoviricetes sp.]DAQ80455.1 MAG TPA: hypothetical protein [Herelleviridae sp.]
MDRFACDWPRLSTTDPYEEIIRKEFYFVYIKMIWQKYLFSLIL